MENENKIRISPTKLSMFFRCGEQFRRRYCQNEKIAPSISQCVGAGVHTGNKLNMSQKIESKQDLQASDIVEVSVAEYEKKAVEVDEQKEVSDGKDKTARMAKTYATIVAPKIQPTMVEQAIEITTPSVNLLGIVDLVDDQKTIIDLKTSGKSKPQSEADDSLQLTFYALAYQALMGAPPAGLRLDVVLDTQKQYQSLTTTRTRADYDVLLARVEQAVQAIEAGIFVPAPSNAYWCSELYCGYARSCPYFNKRGGDK